MRDYTSNNNSHLASLKNADKPSSKHTCSLPKLCLSNFSAVSFFSLNPCDANLTQ